MHQTVSGLDRVELELLFGVIIRQMFFSGFFPVIRRLILLLPSVKDPYVLVRDYSIGWYDLHIGSGSSSRYNYWYHTRSVNLKRAFRTDFARLRKRQSGRCTGAWETLATALGYAHIHHWIGSCHYRMNKAQMHSSVIDLRWRGWHGNRSGKRATETSQEATSGSQESLEIRYGWLESG